MSLLLLALSASPSLADVPPPPAAVAFDLVGAYDPIRAALADDSLTGAAAAARALAEADAGDAEVAAAATRIASASDLAVARAAFSDLSRLVFLRLSAGSPTKVTVYFCPMYAGFGWWLQKSPPIANPYFGSQMRTCGEERALKGATKAAATR